MVCPKCNSADQLQMGDGSYLCLDCRHEHDGTQTASVRTQDAATESTAAPALDSVQRILQADTVADVLASHDTAPDAAPDADTVHGDAGTLIDWAGQFVQRHDGGDLYLCVEDDGGESIAVQGESGPVIPVHRRNYRVVQYEADALAPTIGAETVSESQPFDPAIFATASLVLAQGLACIAQDEEQTLLNPRIGWLPPPCNEVPEVEQGVAYAVAVLVRTFGLPRESVEQIAATLMEGAQAPETETVS